jgi:hypothetical protein
MQRPSPSDLRVGRGGEGDGGHRPGQGARAEQIARTILDPLEGFSAAYGRPGNLSQDRVNAVTPATDTHRRMRSVAG